jgi:alkanesulfonate monooxygenase SsuD/methylene tetrahydromethanopterin reductase-like flavin-dependent oxidoreductase (luciferase family)
MQSQRAAVGICFDRTFPAALATDFARRLDGKADQLWLIEDCFFTAGVSLAAAALSVTEELTVGIGILPVLARNPAITAMEIATLCGLGPGRLLPGLGHGVQSWMQQIGVRTPSPLTTMDEVFTTVTRLLAGERVTFHGREVHLDDVALDQPPDPPPPLLAGVRGPKSLELAGRIAGGVILVEPATPSYVRWAVEQAGNPEDFHVVTFSSLCVNEDRAEARRSMTGWLAEMLDAPTVAMRQVPFYDELQRYYADRGTDALVGIPSDWWAELGPIGTLEDAVAHIEALEAAGVSSVAIFPPPDLDVARSQLDDVLRLATR